MLFRPRWTCKDVPLEHHFGMLVIHHRVLSELLLSVGVGGAFSHLVGVISFAWVCSLRFLLHFQLRKWATSPRANDSRSAILHEVPSRSRDEPTPQTVNQWLHLGCFWINGWEAPEESGLALGWQWAACSSHQKQLWPCGLADERGMEFPAAAAAGIPSCLLGQPHSCYVVSQSWVNLPSLCRSRLWVVQMAVIDCLPCSPGGGERGLGVVVGEHQSGTSLAQCQAPCGNMPVAKPRKSGRNPARFCYNLTTLRSFGREEPWPMTPRVGESG